ncbi:MAG TPA: sugar transporter [Actinomycetales bacterium]|nr:sugar transporter [Actinomycetales bacterium]
MTRNRFTFAIGTLGRDMVYTLQSMFLIFFLTDILDLPDATMWWVSGILFGARIFDAFTDIAMGGIVDNTRTRWGPYKPWIIFGALLSGVVTVLLFTDFGVRGTWFVVLFGAVYLMWGLAWTTNDISYWALLPALSLDPKEREKAGSLAKVFATIGLFAVVVAILPVTNAMGGDPPAWTLFVVVVVLIMLVFQAVTIVGVRQPQIVAVDQHTSVREVISAVVKNDQLLWVALAMGLFYTGYNTTTAFGTYFFKYAYKDEEMYSIFALVLGVSQLIGFALFPVLRARFTRRQIYTLATVVIGLGYIIFFFSPMNIIPIGIAGVLLFVATASMVVLFMMFMTDCIEYGQWKLGRRSTAVTYALQPFVVKVASAFATAIVGVTVILTGINSAPTPEDVTEGGLWGMKVMMMLVPFFLILGGYLIYLTKYKIDEKFHAQIVADLKERGELV